MKKLIAPQTLLALSVFAISTESKAFDFRPPCGLSGSIESRIADCQQSRGLRDEYQLVTRTSEGLEIYRGRRTGVIWSADLDNREKNYLQENLGTICSQNRAEFGGIEGNWVLPPIHRYIQGFRYGIQDALPGLNRRNYWSDTPDPFYVDSRYILEGAVHYTATRGTYTFRHLEVELGKAYVKCIIEPAL